MWGLWEMIRSSGMSKEKSQLLCSLLLNSSMKAPSYWEAQLPAASLPSRKNRPLNSLPSPLSPYKGLTTKGPRGNWRLGAAPLKPLLGLRNLPGISKLAHSESSLPETDCYSVRASFLLCILTRAEREAVFALWRAMSRGRRWRAGHRRNHTTQLRPQEKPDHVKAIT